MVLTLERRLKYKRMSSKLDIIEKLYLAKHLIEINLKNQLNIEQISKEIFLSKFEFIRRYKEVFGITPFKYFQAQKIEATKRELVKGLSLSEIALEYNISDQFTYSKMFKKITGVTPSEFKKGMHTN